MGRLLLAVYVVLGLTGPGGVAGQGPPACQVVSPRPFTPRVEVLLPRARPFVSTPRESASSTGLFQGTPHLPCQGVKWVIGEARDQENTAERARRAILLSAAIPGSGQRFLGQARWVPYLAIEAWSWVRFFDERRRGSRIRGRYEDMAWLVARRISTSNRVDGSFEYYESLTRFGASGAFDVDPTRSGVQPETDMETFNGNVWELASDIFLPPGLEGPIDDAVPGYDQAVAYYIERSVRPGFAWRWNEDGVRQSEFADLIKSSDERFRNSTTMVGIILGNHLVSAVDAFISSRLGSEQGDARLRLYSYPVAAPEPALGLVIRFAL